MTNLTKLTNLTKKRHALLLMSNTKKKLQLENLHKLFEKIEHGANTQDIIAVITFGSRICLFAQGEQDYDELHKSMKEFIEVKKIKDMIL